MNNETWSQDGREWIMRSEMHERATHARESTILFQHHRTLNLGESQR